MKSVVSYQLPVSRKQPAKRLTTAYWQLATITLVLLCLCESVSSQGQGMKLTGVIRDAQDNSAMFGAAVTIALAKDTTKFNGAQTDLNGNFAFDHVAKGTYIFKVSYVGYEHLQLYFKMDSTDKNVGIIKLKPEGDSLKTVVIHGDLPVIQKADTTEYSAAMYKTNPDATTEDLLNKMPGISSNNGTVTAHGETVGKVLVDGKEFFGDDATTAIKNLPAEIVDKVQVFDRLSDQSAFTGFDDGNSVKTINITTKRGKSNGVFGKLYAGYGYLDDSRYNAGGNINWFDGDRRLSLIGMTNNVNIQNFSSQDLLGVLGGRGGRGGGGGSSNNFLTGNQGGINTTTSLGANYIDTWGKKKKVKVAMSYFFNQTDNSTITAINRSYYVKGDETYSENDSSRSTNRNHRVNLRIEYSIDSNNTLIITPKFVYQQNTQYYDYAGQNYQYGEEQFRTANDQYSYNSGYQISGDVLFQHKFPEKYKTFSVDIGTTISNKNGHGSQYGYNYNNATNDSIANNQQFIQPNHSYTVNANLAFTDPVSSFCMMQLNYTPSMTWNYSDQETDTMNRMSERYSMLDTILSSKYSNTYLVQKAGFAFRFRTSNLNASIGLNGQDALLSGASIFPYQYDISHTYLGLLPNIMFNYKFKNTSTLRMYLKTSTSPPSISQLQSVINNSHPTQLSTGNPELAQSYNTSLNIRYGFAKGPKGHSFFAFANISNTMHYVTNSTIIATSDTLIENTIPLYKGYQFTLPVNVNGYWTSNAFLTYGLAVKKLKCNINFNAGFNYSRTPGFINEVFSLSNSYAPTGGIVISSNISEKIDYTLSYSGTYNIIKNNVLTTADNNYFGHSASAKFNWLFWKGFVFNTSVTNTYYESTSGGNFTQDIVIWNMALGYKFLKNKSLEVRASVNDLLNQNAGLSRSVNSTYIEDDRTRLLGRYIMLTLTWTLRYFKGVPPPDPSAAPAGDRPHYGGGGGGYGGYGR